MELAKFTKNNLLQRLKNNYIDDEEFPLAPADMEKKILLEKIWGLRVNNKYHQQDIITILMRPKNRGGEGLSRSTAYRNYVLSQQLFGELDVVDIAAEKVIARAVFHDIYIKALKKGDLKNMTKAYENYMKHIPEDMSDRIDPEMLKASVFRQVLPKEVKNMFKKAAERGVVDLMFIDAEDVEWKESNGEDEDDE
ncbi:hypothetical protein [Chryseobacterium sp. 2R14A]|uniref:hypothetical protein n=1 Tax=Chryseobacterium sp. 2R14A TaxID=3380353 RepID=UPI003CEB426D